MFERIDWVEARSKFRKGIDVYYLYKNGYHILPPFIYENMWGITEISRSKHSFLFSSKKIKEELKLNKLNYFIK